MTNLTATRDRIGSDSLNVDRLAGWSAIGFAVLLVIQNALRSAGAPANDAPAGDVLAYLASAQGTLAILLALFVPGLLALFGFISGLLSRARRMGIETPWSTFGLIGAILIGALFSASNAIEAALVAMAPQLASDPTLVSFAWHLHTAIFALNFAAIGVALLGLSRVALAARLIPGPVAVLAAIGAVILFAGAIPVTAVTSGSAWFFVAFPGFALWIVWLAATGVGLVRADPVSAGGA